MRGFDERGSGEQNSPERVDLTWFDNHCHLGDDAEDVIARARVAGVSGMVNVGTDLEGSRAAIALARSHPDVWATVGVHPHEARHGMDGIAELFGDDTVVAVGEAGLDHHYDFSPRRQQADVFAAQIALANERSMPLVIHTREAWEETFAALDVEGVPARTVFHCFTGGVDEAGACLGRGALGCVAHHFVHRLAHAPELGVQAAKQVVQVPVLAEPVIFLISLPVHYCLVSVYNLRL